MSQPLQSRASCTNLPQVDTYSIRRTLGRNRLATLTQGCTRKTLMTGTRRTARKTSAGNTDWTTGYSATISPAGDQMRIQGDNGFVFSPYFQENTLKQYLKSDILHIILHSLHIHMQPILPQHWIHASGECMLTHNQRVIFHNTAVISHISHIIFYCILCT